MKKLRRALATLIMCCTCVSTLVGCRLREPEVESISVKSGLTTMYLKGDDYSFDNLKIKVVYDDGTEEIVGKDKLTIGEFSTDTLGTHSVKISYKGKELVVKIKVTNNKDEIYEIIAVENNGNYIQYNKNFETNSSADFESLFADVARSEANVYKVGYDNPFVYDLNLTAIDDEDNYIQNLEATKTVTTVYMKENFADANYTKVADADVATYVTIDDENSSYQFKAAAKNKFFKLEIRPFYLKEEQLVSVANYTKSIEFKVVEGYNITNAKQLGILYNVNETVRYTYDNNTKDPINLYNEWTNFLTANGIARDDDTKAIILHSNITITGADVPSVYLATPANLDTPVHANENAEPTNDNALYTDASGNKKVLEENFESDKCGGANVYCHNVNQNDTFTIHGNFFKLEADLPTVDTDLLPNYGSTTSLFRFVSTYSSIESDPTTLANDAAAVAASASAVVNMYNLNSVGNAARTDSTNTENNADSAQMGGLIFVKAPAVTLNVKNSIIKAYLINFYIEQRLSTINLDDVKSYDAYQSIVYGYNGGNMTINDSFLERAGGPVILLATDENDPSEKMVTNITATNSKLESLITGLEPWFAIYNKTPLATQLKSNASVFEGMFNSTFIKSGEASNIEAQLVNAIFISVYNGDITNTSHAMTKLTINGTVVADTTGMNSTLETGTNKKFINDKTNVGGVVFESTRGALVTSATTPQNATEESNFMKYFDNDEYLEYGEEAAVGLAMGRWSTAMGSQGDNDYVGIYTYGMSMVTGYYPATPANPQ